MTEKVAEQIEQVRKSGKANMFDIASVQHIAFEMGLQSCAYLSIEDRSEYALHPNGKPVRNPTFFTDTIVYCTQTPLGSFYCLEEKVNTPHVYKPTQFMAKDSVYSKTHADHAVDFIQCLRHTKGIWSGKPFLLLPWQEQIIRDLFGTIKPNGYRQFNTAHIEIPKKNGKSELAAKSCTTIDLWRF